MLAFGGTSAAAFAQEEPTSTEPTQSETVTPAPTGTPVETPVETPSQTPAPSETTTPPPSSETPSQTPVEPPAPTPTQTAPIVPTGTQAPVPQKPKADEKAAVPVKPNVKTTASLDKSTYASHESVTLTLTYTNNSSVTANALHANVWGLNYDSAQLGELARHRPGVSLAPGESRTVTVSGTISYLDHMGMLSVSGDVTPQDGDADQQDNYFFTTAQVVRTTGHVSGFVYADANRNGQADAGEAVSGGVVSIYGGVPAQEYRTTSGSDGRFSFTGVATGSYYSPYFELPGGWVVRGGPSSDFQVAPDQTTELTGRAERPISEVLTATASLDQATYRFPATAKITVMLTNKGDHPISGIQAGCNRVGDANHLGTGPGWAVFNNPGVTLAAGESRTIVIDEAIPQAALDSGVVRLVCDFAPNVGWNADGPQVATSAKVTSGGTFPVTFVHDKNGNFWHDPGETLIGLEVDLVNEATGAKAAAFTSGPDGKIVFGGVPAGRYFGLFKNGWKTSGGSGSMPVWIPETDNGSSATYFMVPGTADADVRGSLKFDKPSYESHETVRMTATVTNMGGKTAERTRLMWPLSNVGIANEQWGDFGWNAAGIALAPGETRTFELAGPITNLYDGKLRPSSMIEWIGSPNPCNCGISGEVPVTQSKGDISGVVYVDRNRNGQQDAGEAAAGVIVQAGGGLPHSSNQTTTDAEGRFSFPGLPSGDYYLSYTLADGWIVHADGDTRVRVEPGKPVQLTARAERPYSESLSATMTLDKDVYQVGEEAKITITLTNSSDRAISGIQAGCNRIGDGNQLGGGPYGNDTSGWGELLPPGKGVTVGAGETKTFIATEKVPAAAFEIGVVRVGCDFEPNPGYNTDGPWAADSARVPGGFGSLKAHVVHDLNGNRTIDAGEAVANTRVALHTYPEGVETLATVTDANGLADFARVPAGDYTLKVAGFQPVEQGYDFVRISAGRAEEANFFVVPAPQPEPGPGGGASPAPGGATGTGESGGNGGGVQEALAKTGASVLGLGLAAALLMAFGFGARLAGRRRTA
ncbi:SdrD B-like domain-containing protein [Lentzea guizhouensis]|uniref:SdrD B-like domain-containing protein n=1 Tax=Lentzea guizhouensis TaxID=1586287 RepID=UPI0012B6892B|nr:SdrD B-like domain-containing protein [Lentzea guizhouensis]